MSMSDTPISPNSVGTRPLGTAGGPHLDPVLANAPHRIGKVTLSVRDLDRMARFYQDVIGLQVLQQEPRLVRLGINSSVLLELRQDPDARLWSPQEAGLFHTAFLLPDRADLGAWLAFAAQRGITLQGASDHLVSEALYLSDPEGNGIEIYADRPSSAWQHTDGMIAMASDPLDFRDLLNAGAERPWSGYPAGGIIGHVHLQVGALAPADAFYTELGFDITCRYPGASFFGSGGYHHQLAANIWNSRGAPLRSEVTTGLADVEILTDLKALEAVQSRVSTGKDVDGTRLSLRDPWGTSITLVGLEQANS